MRDNNVISVLLMVMSDILPSVIINDMYFRLLICRIALVAEHGLLLDGFEDLDDQWKWNLSIDL